MTASAREQAKEVKKDGDNYGSAALEFAVAYHRMASEAPYGNNRAFFRTVTPK